MEQRTLTLQDWALLISSATFKTSIIGFYLIALITMLKDQGFTLNQLSWIYMLAGIEAAACIISPLIERFSFKRFGHFKSWLFLSNFVMLLSFTSLYFIQPQQHFIALLLVCAAFSLMSLFFSCATLGLTCSLLPFKKRGYGGAIQVAGARIGKMIGGGLALFLYQHLGWHSAISLMVVLSLLFGLQLLFYTEVAVSSEQAEKVRLGFLFKRFIDFWQRPNVGYHWLILLFFSCIPSALVATTFIPRLNELGWQPQNIGLLLAIIIPLICIVILPLSGYFLQKYQRFQVINTILLIQILLVATFCFSEQLIRLDQYLIILPIVLLSVAYSFMLPIILTMLMDKADSKLVTLDTSLQYTIVLLGAYLAGFSALRIVSFGGYTSVYLLATGFTVLIWLMVWFKRSAYA
ncbi:MFS transporter [Testudinibacter sp. TR-2022]|uniref:MFS transporter n=1 Tax=Testudinibacter sp. TR-2022 TaxID=2585029 RepID=UPI00111A06CB|nr:MFS transporter [Testudinibacter sp. TR-2022]TNH08404.1 MFS transporter [Pasteurellaceae bacterium Phil11]TNH20872.1 MFS transporter [Testudinibacter sp. TR-2022]TNH28100.1 MFS transporter [Testudinibacter sp. TR-2022]